MKEKTKKVSNWHELEKLFKDIDVAKETIVLTGWLNTLIGSEKYLKTLFFSKALLSPVKKGIEKNGIKSKSKRI